MLPQALRNTVLLLLGVGLVCAVLGTGSAWLVTAYDFPGRGVLAWALLLPLAVPTYIVAFAYLDLLHPIGPIQTALRTLLGYDSPRQFRLPDLRSLQGAIFVLGFVLYPYVYLTTRAMFLTQSASLLEAARTLGASRLQVFREVALPLARPAIAVGMSLALLETLNDIGASEFLGVQTLTVSIYTTWTTRSDLGAAAQIALSMLALVLALILLERHGRRRQRFANTQRMRPMQPHRLHGLPAAGALVLGGLPVVLGFVLPTAYLVNESVKRLNLVGSIIGLAPGTGQYRAGGRQCHGADRGLRPDAGLGRALAAREHTPTAAARLCAHGQPGLCRARDGAGHRPAAPAAMGRSGAGPSAAVFRPAAHGQQRRTGAGVCHPLSGNSGRRH